MENGKQSGSIEKTAEIKLESCKEQWDLFTSKVLPQFSTSGLIKKKNSDSQLRIEIEMSYIFKPEHVSLKVFTRKVESRLSAEVNQGIQAIDNFFNEYWGAKVWFMLGYIKSSKRKIPVMVIHYEIFNLSIYSTDFNIEEIKKMFPNTPDFHNN